MLGNSPSFTFEQTPSFGWGCARLSLSTKRGKVLDGAIGFELTGAAPMVARVAAAEACVAPRPELPSCRPELALA